MKVRILGTAAGGGIPQWNCACVQCGAARESGEVRSQDSVAVSGNGQDWFLINASPDIRAQLLATASLAPGPGRRDTPLRGVLLTTAELDHTIGLLSLREASELTVYASPTVHAVLPLLHLVEHYCSVQKKMLEGTTRLPGGLTVRALVVGRKRPRYAASATDVTALRITDGRASFVYATCLPAWTAEFDAFVTGADHVLLDGTFATEDELTVATGRSGSAAGMGHLPVAASRPLLARHPGTAFWYSHLNNTNPLRDGVAHDGQWLG